MKTKLIPNNRFGLKDIYWGDKTPKQIANIINSFKDEKLQMIILPTSYETADLIIRDIPRIIVMRRLKLKVK